MLCSLCVEHMAVAGWYKSHTVDIRGKEDSKVKVTFNSRIIPMLSLSALFPRGAPLVNVLFHKTTSCLILEDDCDCTTDTTEGFLMFTFNVHWDYMLINMFKTGTFFSQPDLWMRTGSTLGTTWLGWEHGWMYFPRI